MAEFSNDLHSFELSLPSMEMDSSLEMMLENPTLSPNSLLGLSNDIFFLQPPELPASFSDDNLLDFPVASYSNAALLPQSSTSVRDGNQESKKRKSMALSKRYHGDYCSQSPQLVFEEKQKIRRKNIYGGEERRRCSEKQVGEPNTKNVIHVRAKRGQATDSHSIAERARREKINEKLRSLQDIVPGCYKTMGMAAMLDEIIKYLQSLQNQIDFLSMKLSAANSFYNFCLEMEAMETEQVFPHSGFYVP